MSWISDSSKLLLTSTSFLFCQNNVILFYTWQWNQCISKINKCGNLTSESIWYFHNNKSMLFSVLVSEYVGSLHCYLNRWCKWLFRLFVNSLFLNKTIKCDFSFPCSYKIRNSLVPKSFLIWRKFGLVCLALHVVDVITFMFCLATSFVRSETIYNGEN